MRKFLVPLLVLLCILGCSCVTWFLGYDRGFREAGSNIQRDTVWKDTTIFVDRPVEVEKWKVKEKLVYVPMTDTVHHYHNDTTYIGFPREYKTYKGDEYEAVVSGVDPILESLKISQKTAYITNTVERPVPYKWTLSAFGEAAYPLGVRTGLLFDKKAAGPLRWYIDAGYEYNPAHKGVFVEGGVRLEIIHK